LLALLSAALCGQTAWAQNAASRTVLPLPTHQSRRYAPGSGRLEDDPVYRRHKSDFERYHTRYVSPDGARDALRAKIVPDHP